MKKLAPPKIVNETCYDGRGVSGVVRWVFRYLDLNGYGVMVKVKHHDGGHAYQGRYYQNPSMHGGYVYDNAWGQYKWVGPKVPRGTNHLIVCRIGKPGTYPTSTHVYDRKDVPEPWIVDDWREALVSITAHEAIHLRHRQVPRSRNRGMSNESDTEWAAFRLWKEWRNTH